jgi:3-methyl-2-oxobutanoate hydroxymethyltransferase
MVMLGYETTIAVTMEDILHHTKAVTRGAKNAFIIADMPFMTYHLSIEQALSNAARLVQEGGAQGVKLEGGVNVADKVRAITSAGIPVMGHIGFTPQYIYELGGFKAQGKTRERAKRLLEDARALEQAGAFAVVLELVPSPLANLITQKLSIPTIGIGAGADCDGQVQVISDILGLDPDFIPRHAKRYAHIADIMTTAVTLYCQEVKEGTFPTEKESIGVDPREIEGLE